MPLVWSEEPELLGTAGALPPLRAFLEPADRVLVVNGAAARPSWRTP